MGKNTSVSFTMNLLKMKTFIHFKELHLFLFIILCVYLVDLVINLLNF